MASWNENKLFVLLLVMIGILGLEFSKYSIPQNHENVSKKVIV